ncbi:Plant invertase/pectin methylesterase inhibitor superfamily protein [Hibiscus syriacus]|uniref:pectinesterase n=2 Tax=Hibiscus syriacus TaxID=106335 RepID=A0A6A2WN86_HIBSY|nr:Plant invertase/pectin methylesterase inhibitor superfamily protein [Hibiscus syriacus]
MSICVQTISAATTDKGCTKTYKKFIKSACNSTTYPKICYGALSPNASAIKTDPYKLCSIALSVTLKATYKAYLSIDALSKMRGLSRSEKEIIGDCAETTDDAIYQLQKSLKALARLKGSNHKADEISDLNTWVSAVLTDEYTCTDDFEGQKVRKDVKNTINKRMLYLAKLTSNCLALFKLLD